MSLVQSLESHNQIRVFDRDEVAGLKLYCYTECNNDSDRFVKDSRGLVFHGDEMVMNSFSFCEEYKACDVKLESVLGDFSNWSFYNSLEGSLLRLFHFNDRWYLSTHHRLDAFKSRWSSGSSFGELFVDALKREYEYGLRDMFSLEENEDIFEAFKNRLDKTEQYVFLLRNTTQNRIVCDAPSKNDPGLCYIGCFKNNVLETSSIPLHLYLPTPSRLTFENVEELNKYVEECDVKKYQGVVGFSGTHCVKIVSPSYSRLFNVRGNQPSLKYRYLEVRNNVELKQDFLNLYTDMKNTFSEYERNLNSIASVIHKYYMRRFVRHEYLMVAKPYFKIMSSCHTDYKNTGEIVTLQKVLNKINSQPPSMLIELLRSFESN